MQRDIVLGNYRMDRLRDMLRLQRRGNMDDQGDNNHEQPYMRYVRRGLVGNNEGTQLPKIEEIVQLHKQLLGDISDRFDNKQQTWYAQTKSPLFLANDTHPF